VVIDHVFRAPTDVEAAGRSNAVLLIASFAIFLVLFEQPRRNGSMIQGGEYLLTYPMAFLKVSRLVGT